MTQSMYQDYFGISENPFSIIPNPSYLYMSQRHQEALAHLLYGVSESGGFVLLTGEVGTGKTTICRALMEQLPDNTDLALILNPKLSETELMAAICDEMRIPYPIGTKSLKDFFDFMNHYLLRAHASGRNPVLMIDEAQNLRPDVLELIRLLTNLETAHKKLLQIILVGQPELNHTLALPEMRQTAQRITARYHLEPLGLVETRGYIEHRLKVAGLDTRIFTNGAVKTVHKSARGIPRLINSICDRALLAAYVEGKKTIEAKLAKRAAAEVLGTGVVNGGQASATSVWGSMAMTLVLTGVLLLGAFDPYHWGIHDTIARILAPILPPQRAENAPSPTPATPQNEPKPVAEPEPEPVASTEAEPQPAAPIISPDTMPEAIMPDGTPPPPGLDDAGEQSVAGMADGGAPLFEAEEKIDISQAQGTLIGDLIQSGTPDRAFFQLFQLWNQDFLALDGLTPCDKAKQAGLNCQQGATDVTGLKSMNRPVVVSFSMPDGELLYGVISTIETDLVGESVTVDFGERAVTMRTQAFGLRWPGDYLVMWKPHDIIQRPVAFGQQGQDVVELRRLLAKAGYPDGPNDIEGQGSVFFGPSLREQVRRFQQDHSLEPNGIADEQTVMRITGVAVETFVTPIVNKGPSPVVSGDR
ncbi:AAA family ATPase [Magnetovibrio sp.]|uniref:AAA family ATPase n=1 Tax=Magnetovibrio sp. TaxID=2024836 RepID=UPI002F955644